jgi:hypothetical protein
MFPKLSTTQTVAGNLTESSVDDAAVAEGQELPVDVVEVVVTTEVETVFERAVCASAADGTNAVSNRSDEITNRRVFAFVNYGQSAERQIFNPRCLHTVTTSPGTNFLKDSPLPPTSGSSAHIRKSAWFVAHPEDGHPTLRCGFEPTPQSS